MERLKTLMSKKVVIVVSVILAIIIVLTGVFIALNKKQDATLKKEQVAKVEQEIESAYINYDKAGTYSKKMEYASGEVSVGDVIIENATFDTLEIKDSVGDGSVTLNNCNVNKCFVINGGGTNSVRINGGKYNEVISNKYNCHIVIDKTADIKTLTVPSTALIEIDGKVETCNVLKGDYAGDVTWETGVKLGDNATVTTLNVDEALSAENNAASVVEVSNNNTNAIKSQNTMSSEQVAKVQQTTVAQTQNVSQNAQTQWSNQQQIIASNPNITPANNNTNVTPAGSNASNNSKTPTNSTPTNSTPTWNNNSSSSNGGSSNGGNNNAKQENWVNYWDNQLTYEDAWENLYESDPLVGIEPLHGYWGMDENGNKTTIVWGEYGGGLYRKSEVAAVLADMESRRVLSVAEGGGGYLDGNEFCWNNQQVLKEVWNNNYITQKY